MEQMNSSYFLYLVYHGTFLLKSIILSSMTPGNCGGSTFLNCSFVHFDGSWGGVGWGGVGWGVELLVV